MDLRQSLSKWRNRKGGGEKAEVRDRDVPRTYEPSPQHRFSYCATLREPAQARALQ